MKLKKLRKMGWKIKAPLFITPFAIIALLFIFERRASAPCIPDIKTSRINDIISIPSRTAVKAVVTTSGTNDKILKLTDITLPPVHVGLDSSSEPQLQKLAKYEQSAGGALANGMMVFTNTPVNQSQVQSHASDMLACIKDFSKFGIKPLVIMEPSTDNGSIINFSSYRNGAYDSYLDAYFSYLKNHGVTESEMGMWVYFPEANLPEWGPVDVNDFGPNVTRTVNIQKKYFPASLSSIMLDAQSYPAGSSDWDSGSYVSLTPFISSIPAGIIDSFGLQGFPWAPPANQGGAVSYDPTVYLKASLASEAAGHLVTKKVWLNTGTFHAKYTNSKSQTIVMSPQQRQTLLNGVLNQVNYLKNAGLVVSVNLFSEDKSNTDEATDWSYKSADDQTVLNNFALQLNQLSVSFWIFDD